MKTSVRNLYFDQGFRSWITALRCRNVITANRNVLLMYYLVHNCFYSCNQLAMRAFSMGDHWTILFAYLHDLPTSWSILQSQNVRGWQERARAGCQGGSREEKNKFPSPSPPPVLRPHRCFLGNCFPPTKSKMTLAHSKREHALGYRARVARYQINDVQMGCTTKIRGFWLVNELSIDGGGISTVDLRNLRFSCKISL